MTHLRDLQDFLYQGQHLPMRPHYRDLVILFRQRIKVLNRLRSQNFDLYCKTMEILNLEHHQEPILKDRFQMIEDCLDYILERLKFRLLTWPNITCEPVITSFSLSQSSSTDFRTLFVNGWKTVCRKPFTEHIIDMKLRTMNQIEQNIKKERKLRSTLGTGFYISVYIYWPLSISRSTDRFRSWSGV